MENILNNWLVVYEYNTKLKLRYTDINQNKLEFIYRMN